MEAVIRRAKHTKGEYKDFVKGFVIEIWHNGNRIDIIPVGWIHTYDSSLSDIYWGKEGEIT
jgi:hypothetical protein